VGFEVRGPRGGAGETLRSVLVLWARGRRHVHCLYFVPMLREQGRHLIFLRVRPGEAFLNMPPSIDLNVLLVGFAGSQLPFARCLGGVLELASSILQTLDARLPAPIGLRFSGRRGEVSARATCKLIQGLRSQEKELEHRQASTLRLPASSSIVSSSSFPTTAGCAPVESWSPSFCGERPSRRARTWVTWGSTNMTRPG